MAKRSSRQKAARTGGFTSQQVDAAVAARDRAAAGNPQAVRRAFLGGQPIQLGGLEILPLTVGTFWLLEEIGSPLAGKGGDAGAPASFQQIAEAAFILTEPQRASEVLAKGRDIFAAAAFRVACQIPVGDVERLTAALFGRVAEAEAVMPPEAGGEGQRPLAGSPPRAPA